MARSKGQGRGDACGKLVVDTTVDGDGNKSVDRYHGRGKRSGSYDGHTNRRIRGSFRWG